jgi:uncharacterized protein YndB with AHSA1/START domain
VSTVSQAEHTVIIGRSADDVFDYLADGCNNPQWRRGVLEIERTSPEVGVGATYRQVLRGPGGRKIAGDYRVTKYERSHALAFEVIAGPARPVGSFELTPIDGDSTRVTFRLAASPTGVMRLMSPMITKQMRAETAQLENLKTRLESQT